MKQQQLQAGACTMDPPWPGQGVPYRTLSVRRIMEFPLRDFMAPNSHLYLWVPQGLVATGVKVAEHYGATVRGVITWVKSRPGRPTRYLQANTELLLFCTFGDAPALVKGQQTLLCSPTMLSGQKPDEHYSVIERLSKPPYLEIFSRTEPRSEDWVTWGDELEKSAIRVPGWPVPSDFHEEVA
ncbi:MAG: methyltransferase [Archangium gephyra]|uniref:Methyltransferase n=1 Tax=Archangium gephyra TaxID=48 RepID=A0A2W5UYX1_9BACT|nr:MAG: methyltransferase [Archangium gephyra]